MAARKNKIKHDEKTKEAIRASQLVNFLADAALKDKQGKKVDPTRVAAAKAVLPFLRPQLSAVEQTNVEPRDQLKDDEILARLQALVIEKPHLLDQLNALRSATNTPSPQVSSEDKRVTH